MTSKAVNKAPSIAVLGLTRKAYDRPMTQVVKLEHQARLMDYSATREEYGEANTSTWGA